MVSVKTLSSWSRAGIQTLGLFHLDLCVSFLYSKPVLNHATGLVYFANDSMYVSTNKAQETEKVINEDEKRFSAHLYCSLDPTCCLYITHIFGLDTVYRSL